MPERSDGISSSPFRLSRLKTGRGGLDLRKKAGPTRSLAPAHPVLFQGHRPPLPTPATFRTAISSPLCPSLPLRCRRCPKFCTTYRDIVPKRRRCPILKDTYRSAGVTAAESGALSRSPGERRAVAAESAFFCEAAPQNISDLRTLLVALLQQAKHVTY